MKKSAELGKEGIQKLEPLDFEIGLGALCLRNSGHWIKKTRAVDSEIGTLDQEIC